MNIIFFFKEPTPGEVKTRLGKTIGFDTASVIYRRLLEHNIRIIYSLLEKTSKRNLLNFFPYIAQTPLAKSSLSLKPYTKINIQATGNLGEKMHSAMEEVYQKHPCPSIIIGSDTLDLSPQKLKAAILGLKKSESVIAPTVDGGYYLIGLKKPRAEVFLNRNWSHCQVFKEQISLFKKLKIPYETLSEGRDLDVYEDLSFLSKENPYLFFKLTKDLL